MIGIYKITNLINGKVYIGKSLDIERRWKDEIKNPPNKHLKNAFIKYGLDNFKFEILLECDEEILNEQEEYWINYFDSYRNGYNKTFGGNGVRGLFAWNKGLKKENDERVLKYSEKISEKAKLRTGEKNPMFGKKHTEESKQKSRKSHLGKKHTEESKQKMSQSRKANKNYQWVEPTEEMIEYVKKYKSYKKFKEKFGYSQCIYDKIRRDY